MRSFQFNDVHHTFEGKLIEIEPVAHVIVRGNGLWVIIDKHSPVAFLADCFNAVHGAPVEFYRASDTVCA